jgi:hypothetical protein
MPSSVRLICGGPIWKSEGERETALQFIRKWVSEEVTGYLKICDPFFGVNDLEALKILQTIQKSCNVFILTSRKQQLQDKVEVPWDDAFRSHWRIHVSDQEPPRTEVVIVMTRSTGELPIHDRWWLTKDGGILMGTSFGSLGVKKVSEMTILSLDESKLLEKEVDQYLNRVKQESGKEKLLYTLFVL